MCHTPQNGALLFLYEVLLNDLLETKRPESPQSDFEVAFRTIASVEVFVVRRGEEDGG